MSLVLVQQQRDALDPFCNIRTDGAKPLYYFSNSSLVWVIASVHKFIAWWAHRRYPFHFHFRKIKNVTNLLTLLCMLVSSFHFSITTRFLNCPFLSWILFGIYISIIRSLLYVITSLFLIIVLFFCLTEKPRFIFPYTISSYLRDMQMFRCYNLIFSLKQKFIIVVCGLLTVWVDFLI